MHILLIDDDINLSKIIAYQLQHKGFKVTVSNNGKKALDLFTKQDYDIIITDIQMPGITGMEILSIIRSKNQNVIIIIITAYGSVENAIEACKLGANDYLTKPFGQEQLLFTIEKAVKLSQLEKENQLLRFELFDKYQFENMVAHSVGMEDTLKMAHKVAQSDSTVLILGESGTGKELLARGIHYNSKRKDKPLITVNCPSIPQNLLESELFGHVKGSFTGAIKDRLGKFEQANKGTIFLDEIGDLKEDLQAKLLRVLQEQEIEKIGTNTPIPLDVRIIAATNKDLTDLMNHGKFREDLYYRLSVVPLTLPPLRERREEIPYLIKYFIEKYSDQKKIKINPQIIETLQQYDWPGNVRELENIVQRMIVLASSSELGFSDIPESILHRNKNEISKQFFIPDEGIALSEMERQVIEQTLQRTKGNQSEAARILKIPRHVLLYRLKKFGLK